MKMKLSAQKCVPCEGGVTPMSRKEAQRKLKEHASQLKKWRIALTKVKGKKALALQKEYRFKKSLEGAKFCSQVWKAAERQGHHPDIFLQYGKATVTWATHAIKGLSMNDFIMASTTEEVYKRFQNSEEDKEAGLAV